MTRTDGRKWDELRPVELKAHVARHAEGSVKIRAGNTVVMCTASVEESVPRWLKSGSAKSGWVTAEYAMLPRSTSTRISRDRAVSGGRSQEISRLIGRSLRSCVDLSLLGERKIIVDCDVLQADGGTRTYAITGGFVALALAVRFLQKTGKIEQSPIKGQVAAISVGLGCDGVLLDLNYDEDSTTGVDMNFVLNDKNRLIELQGTAERGDFSHTELNDMLSVATKACAELFEKQVRVLA